jgi:Rap1a immunity proteins
MKSFLWGLLTVVVALCGASVCSRAATLDNVKDDGFSSLYPGNDFFKLCSSSEADSQHACSAYVCGVVDALSAEYIMTGKRNYSICLPTLTTTMTCGQIAGAVTKFLVDNPEGRASAAAGAIGYALQRKFPCGEGSK